MPEYFETMLKKYWKSIAFTIIILYLSFANMPEVPPKLIAISWDKLAHIGMYFILTFLLMLEYFKGKKLMFKRISFILICLFYPAFLGAITEIVQEAFFAPREADIFDWLADVTGIITSWYFFSLTNKKQRK